ncbi:hypothetical protein ACFORL_12540 [Legionella dresdenensis]|uniref:Dot/Icm T4SS effector n=1 Tax=Legionella dresdenensis TaxID=450200 RepID=A0ABV8CIH8_9GAMM
MPCYDFVLYPRASLELEEYLRDLSRRPASELQQFKAKASNLLQQLSIVKNPYSILFTMANLLIAEQFSRWIIHYSKSYNNREKWLTFSYNYRTINVDLIAETIEEKRSYAISEIIYPALNRFSSLRNLFPNLDDNYLRYEALKIREINWNAICFQIESNVVNPPNAALAADLSASEDTLNQETIPLLTDEEEMEEEEAAQILLQLTTYPGYFFNRGLNKDNSNVVSAFQQGTELS